MASVGDVKEGKTKLIFNFTSAPISGHSYNTSSTRCHQNKVNTRIALLTSSGRQGGELVLGDGEAGVVVGGDLEVVPGGGVQVQHHEVAPGLHVVGDDAPVLLVLWFVLHHEVDDGTAAVLPGVQVESDAPSRHLQEPPGVGNCGLHSLGLGRHHGGGFAQTNTVMIMIMIRMSLRLNSLTHSL